MTLEVIPTDERIVTAGLHVGGAIAARRPAERPDGIHSADLVARTAAVPGEDPAPCRALFGGVRDAFRAAYVSAGGRVKGDTRTSGTAPGTFRLEVSLPVDTTAEVWMAASAASEVAHGPARFLRLEDGCAVFAAGCGTHRFSRRATAVHGRGGALSGAPAPAGQRVTPSAGSTVSATR
ncbi:hypothetical protein [Streptomyces sp. CLV115]|uniref:hypothetical protein n=1 Tax=Streptomyces sp. CLV115 TaxID=3138502 RepID=UPI00406CC140